MKTSVFRIFSVFRVKFNLESFKNHATLEGESGSRIFLEKPYKNRYQACWGPKIKNSVTLNIWMDPKLPPKKQNLPQVNLNWKSVCHFESRLEIYDN